ncbi:MAG: toxin-antitoxin system HicB family antitoxin [Acidobacteria bacterium]|nr:toxin-antitoxin system HicB family antitoxin [Acidobacteriota bacterium]
MVHLQVKNVPDSLHGRLRSLARETNRTVSAAVLDAVEREVTAWEWKKRLAERPATDLGVEAATLVAEARAQRDRRAG